MRSDARSRRPLLPHKSTQIAILGTGLIGASIGMRARARGDRVTGWDSNSKSASLALERGALDAIAVSEAVALGDADTIVLATPLAATLEVLERFSSNPPRAALVLDVASVKLPVAAAGSKIASFVPTHPIAGSERSGPAAADGGLFENRAWVYDPNAPLEAVERALAFIRAMGARPVPVPAALHDRLAALTSHLPQVTAVALASQLAVRLGDEGVLELCGTGIRSMTRLGASSWQMWESILGANAPNVAQEVRSLSAILSEIADELEANRVHSLRSRFATAAGAVGSLTDNEAAPAGVEDGERNRQ
jgi:prephenate dehydrogenase